VANEIYTQKMMASTQITQEIQEMAIPRFKAAGITYMPMPGGGFSVMTPAGTQDAFREINQEMNAERDRRITESNAKIDREYQMRKDAQAALAKNISRVSPASALTFGATTLAGTGTEDYNRFWKAVMDYKPVVNTWLRTNPDLRAPNPKPGMVVLAAPFKEIDPATLAGMPQPAIGLENLNRSITRILPDFIAMIVMIVFLTGGAYFAFIHCDVR
jgi:hypothetical protein